MFTTRVSMHSTILMHFLSIRRLDSRHRANSVQYQLWKNNFRDLLAPSDEIVSVQKYTKSNVYTFCLGFIPHTQKNNGPKTVPLGIHCVDRTSPYIHS